MTRDLLFYFWRGYCEVMLRKMGKAFEKDQTKDDIMSSVLNSSSESLAQKSGLFRFPALLVRLSTKGLLDSDSVWSPTSPLDYKFFSNIGSSSVRSPRSPGPGGQPKSWDASRVGLGLVDTLNEEGMASHNKKVLLGSELKTNIPGSKPQFDVIPGNSSVVTPEFLSEANNTCLQAPVRSCSQLGQQQMELDSDKVEMQIKNCDDVPKSSVAMLVPNYISDGLISPLSMSSIPQSEDYTCIISHGPNPRTTHIFGDLILETHISRSLTVGSGKYWEGKEGFPRVVKSSEDLPFYPCNDLFSFCCSCRKKLKEGKDIYIYLGEKAFCSSECRENFIAEEAEEEECMIDSASSPDPFFSEDCLFQPINH
ncbi:FCS-Like Zinc finger 10-like isoform X2 [Typha latifolia]|uniref:FCS-Like Zinc finger 10-like isoform X2 n=1 Tax=Typha latifolia TaxID=4733 RepID=UPI003C2D0E5A